MAYGWCSHGTFSASKIVLFSKPLIKGTLWIVDFAEEANSAADFICTRLAGGQSTENLNRVWQIGQNGDGR
jgi:hypothetical protein